MPAAAAVSASSPQRTAAGAPFAAVAPQVGLVSLEAGEPVVLPPGTRAAVSVADGAAALLSFASDAAFDEFIEAQRQTIGDAHTPIASPLPDGTVTRELPPYRMLPVLKPNDSDGVAQISPPPQHAGNNNGGCVVVEGTGGRDVLIALTAAAVAAVTVIGPSADAGGGKQPRSLSTTSSAAVEVGAMVASDADELALRAQHRDYIRGVKDILRVNLARESAASLRIARSLDQLPHLETDFRRTIALAEASGMVDIFTVAIDSEERLARAAIRHAKKQDTLVPWCTEACNACCMSRIDWATHTREVSETQVAFLSSCEALARTTIEESEVALREQLLAARWDQDTRRHATALAERRVLAADEATERARLQDAATAEWQRRIDLEWAAVIQRVKATEAAMKQRERTAEVMRVEDTLDLRERRAYRKAILLLGEQEVTGRRGIVTLEEVLHQQLLNRFQEYFSAEQVARCTMTIADLKLQRDELLEYQKEKHAEERDRDSDAARRTQRELEEELKEIKRLKKIKGNPPPPVCPRCTEPVGSGNLHQHRIEECPARPIMCPKCETVMRFDTYEEHKLICPARVVNCAQCCNWYRASYLDGDHLNVCLNAKEARRVLRDDLKPMWPFKIVNDSLTATPQAEGGEDDGSVTSPTTDGKERKQLLPPSTPTAAAAPAAAADGGVLITLDDDSVASPIGNDSSVTPHGSPVASALHLVGYTGPYQLEQVDDVPIASLADLEELLVSMSIGERCTLHLKVSEQQHTSLPPMPAPEDDVVGGAARRPSTAGSAANSMNSLSTDPRTNPSPSHHHQHPPSSANSVTAPNPASSLTPGGGTGSSLLAAAAAGGQVRRDVKVQTSIPLAEYRTLALIVAEDDGHMCTAPAQKKKGGAKK